MIDSEDEARAYVANIAENEALLRIEAYIAALREENTRQNLVSRSSLNAVWTRHIADSAQLLRFVPRGTQPWLDLGSGAGAPGLILACLRPDQPIILVESRTRRSEWLRAMAEMLQLDCLIESRRLEQVPTRPAGAILARAFAPLPRLLDLSRRFSTSDSVFVLPKGRSAAQELAALPIREASGFHVEQSITDAESGIIVGQLNGNRRIEP